MPDATTLPAPDTQTESAPSAASEAASPSSDGSSLRSWLDTQIGRLWGGRSAAPASDADPETDAEQAAEPDQGKDAAAQPDALTLTQDELDRRVQAEVDRREAKRQREQREAEKRRLRKEDPYAYAELEEQEEAQQQTTQQFEQHIATIASAFDAEVLNPLTAAVPDAELQRILALENAGVGLEGRRLVVAESLKALEKHWRTEGAKDAEQKLRKNPAVRKELLAELRGISDEPDLAPAEAPTRTRDVNAILRQSLGIAT
jgi:hypothetical protein